MPSRHRGEIHPWKGFGHRHLLAIVVFKVGPEFVRYPWVTDMARMLELCDLDKHGSGGYMMSIGDRRSIPSQFELV